MDIQELAQAWQITTSLNILHAPASQQDLRKVEAELGFPLPISLQNLYLFSNGLYLFQGNLRVYPLFPGNGSHALSNASIQCREWFQIPPEVLIFGDNGGDEHYGIWITDSRSDKFEHPILEIGELFHDPACMAVVATNLLSFLYEETAFFSLLYEVPSQVLNTIGVPQELQVTKAEISREHHAKLPKWVDDLLPDHNPDPYKKGLNTQQVKELFRE